jgi:hypothetical protein
MAVFEKVSHPSRPVRFDRQRILSMADGAKFTIYYLLVNDGVVSSWLADFRRAIAHESAGNYFPSLISTDYTLVTLVPTLLRGNAVLAALRLDWEERPGRYLHLFQTRALHKR